ncbi:spore-associated protein A [Streptomyces sp. NBC_01476]|uniref:spore-associated protein A n=1 Tax=Streptomyces sp. NBC_01476 TaxID=2903881 RepID=UPI002E2EC6A7|nr:spore-associated protein A [Streptomyces sp. NBC_01476]
MKRIRTGAVVTGLAAAGLLGTFAIPASAGAAATSAPASTATAPATAPVTTASAVTASAKTATAATAPANVAYNKACGAGYGVVDHVNVGRAGTVYLTWNDRTGENCVVTVRTKPGPAVYMLAGIFLTGNTEIGASDSGAYTTYAGPVYLPARAQCVSWRGMIADQFVSAQGHCG